MQTRTRIVWGSVWLAISIAFAAPAWGQTVPNFVHKTGATHYKWGDVSGGISGIMPRPHRVQTSDGMYVIKDSGFQSEDWVVAQHPDAGGSMGQGVDVIIVDSNQLSAHVAGGLGLYAIAAIALVAGVVLGWIGSRFFRRKAAA